jgi:glutathione S-transferase
MALEVSNTAFEHREIELKHKPSHLLEISPKGTVPVLWIQDQGEQRVIEQSLDIMRWALARHDPEGWLLDKQIHQREMLDLIKENDEHFKFNLDRYKYPHRYQLSDPMPYRHQGQLFLEDLNNRLEKSACLWGPTRCLADVALMPFVRQFSKVDPPWFEQLPFEKLKAWLHDFESSALFVSIMSKKRIWAHAATTSNDNLTPKAKNL